GNASVIILPVIIVLFIAAFGISSFACDEYPKFSPNHRSYPLGLVSAVTAVVFGYVSAAELIDSGERMFTGPAGIVYSVFGLLSVVSFSFLAIGFLRRENNIESSPFTLLFPIIWAAMRMVLTFLRFTTVANISEDMYDLVMMVAVMLFFVSMSKFMAGASGISSKWVFFSGCTAILFSMLTTIPRYILSLVKAM
ncbi:MAG: hypothetical protein IJP17_00155, partial [Clostridia bacterium]|nr:hypothetical protein [Clostridia bacterium]